MKEMGTELWRLLCALAFLSAACLIGYAAAGVAQQGQDATVRLERAE